MTTCQVGTVLDCFFVYRIAAHRCYAHAYFYYVNELWSEARKLIYAIESKPMDRKIDTFAGIAQTQ